MTQSNLQKFAEATGYELIDEDGDFEHYGFETQETLCDWEESSRDWAEKTHMIAGEIDGFDFVCWKSAQTNRGDKRRELSVIDLGNVRVVLECAITLWA